VPTIGAMVLKPGEQTIISMSFMMHEGMDGMHDFRVHVPNNDPDQSNKELVVLSNWVP
jgi:hypothetical protein